MYSHIPFLLNTAFQNSSSSRFSHSLLFNSMYLNYITSNTVKDDTGYMIPISPIIIEQYSTAAPIDITNIAVVILIQFRYHDMYSSLRENVTYDPVPYYPYFLRYIIIAIITNVKNNNSCNRIIASPTGKFSPSRNSFVKIKKTQNSIYSIINFIFEFIK